MAPPPAVGAIISGIYRCSLQPFAVMASNCLFEQAPGIAPPSPASKTPLNLKGGTKALLTGEPNSWPTPKDPGAR